MGTPNLTSETEKPTGQLLGGIIDDIQRLIELEVDLARTELKELARTNAIAAASFAVAGVLALLALLVALPVLIVAIVGLHWIAALVWLLLYVIAAAALALFGRSKLRIQAPTKTIDSLKENREWLVQRMKSARL